MAIFFIQLFPQFIVDMKLHINASELFTIVVVVKLWGAFLKEKKLVVNTDSSVSCQVLNFGFSRDHFLQSCLREICFYAALHEFQKKKQISYRGFPTEYLIGCLDGI